MPLPKTTQDRIERDAIEYMHSEIKGMVGDTDELQPSSLKYAHIAGAIAQAELAQNLVEALEQIAKSGKNIRSTYKTSNIPFYVKIAEDAIQQWNAGKEATFKGSVITEPVALKRVNYWIR